MLACSNGRENSNLPIDSPRAKSGQRNEEKRRKRNHAEGNVEVPEVVNAPHRKVAEIEYVNDRRPEYAPRIVGECRPRTRS